MRDIKHGDPMGLQIVNDSKQSLCVGFGKTGSWLVKDEQARVTN